MDNSAHLPRAGHITKLELTRQGSSTEAAYSSRVSSGGTTLHLSQSAARFAWASTHRLEPDDGAYLFELSFRPLTMNQLGEAVATYSQTREMVATTVQRLVVRGYVSVLGA